MCGLAVEQICDSLLWTAWQHVCLLHFYCVSDGNLSSELFSAVLAVLLTNADSLRAGGCIRLVTVDAAGAHHTYVRGDQVPYRDLPRPIAAAQAAGMVIG